MNDRQPRVVVVGGGIGGLATAIGLRRRSVEAIVYEQSRDMRHQGAGVAIGANGHRALRDLGVTPRLELSAVAPLRVDFRHWRTGRSMVTHALDISYQGRFGAPFWTVERSAMRFALLAELGEQNVRLGSQCIGVEITQQSPVIRFADGRDTECDAVVGADGIHSAIRASVFGPDEAVFSGTNAYRALVPMERLGNVPGLAEPVLWLWLGPGRHFIAYPVAAGTALNFLAVVQDQRWTTESWSAEGHTGQLLEAFAGWHPFVTEILAASPRPGRWALYDREPLRNWSSGPVTLLGDAAHAMLPHHGQGANQALEDAVVLADLLSGSDIANIPRALRRYEQVRRPRTRLLQAGSRANADCFQLPDGPAAQERNARLASLPDDLAWIHAHDALGALRAPAGA